MSMLPDPSQPAEGGATDHGEVFTRRWVVELILDLCGYTANRDLCSLTAIEPSCGSGAFLVPMIARLAESAKKHSRAISTAPNAIRAQDIQKGNVTQSRLAAKKALIDSGLGPVQATRLARRWVREGDFLLEPPPEEAADFVIGNPPYIRLEAIARNVSDAYRQACPAMGGRSDIYIGFYERGLLALRNEGVLGFICADRWMRNAYGARLRELISRDWAVDAIVSMTEVDAFEDEVSAYPAITVLRRTRQTSGPLIANAGPEFGAADARRLVRAAGGNGSVVTTDRFHAARMPRWFGDRAGWPHGSPAQLAVMADIEQRLPSLEDEETGTKVGIGLATGADRVFIARDPDTVEPERTVPLAMVRDIADGELAWSGHYLINPWDEQGLVNLSQWPKLEGYLTEHKAVLAKRHTARSGKWHKTIDRLIPGLESSEKLYLPDFKEMLFPVIDRGESYPHHNLYWIISEQWDLEVLGGILLSEIPNLFVSAYSVRMRGGYLRFQAQYLRRIRIPKIEDLDRPRERELRKAFRARDRKAANVAALPLYGLDTLPA